MPLLISSTSPFASSSMSCRPQGWLSSYPCPSHAPCSATAPCSGAALHVFRPSPATSKAPCSAMMCRTGCRGALSSVTTARLGALNSGELHS